jgi:hypothetical protein
MAKPSILLQLDTDPRPSVFDAVVAIDAGVQHLISHGGVTPAQVRDLVYGAIFTRGVEDLSQTAIFIGGSDVNAGEILLREVQQTFIGSLRVSVMLDSNGANTTAAAVALAAARHVDLSTSTAVVLAATGPVGSRTVELLAGAGARVRVTSRSMERAEATARGIAARYPNAKLEPVATESAAAASVFGDAQVLISAGAPGVEIVSADARLSAGALRVAIDLSAVPPAGIAGVEPKDKGEIHHGCAYYGALGVGGLKMKIHKAAIRQLFKARDQALDASQIFAIGRQLTQSS